MIKTIDQEKISGFNTRKVLKGSLISIATTIILLTVFSIILTYTKVPENTVNTVTIIITGISILLGGQITTKNLKKNGIVNGILVGLIYMATIYLLSSIVTKNFGVSTNAIIMIAVGVLAGGVGGIIGVNLK